MTSINCFQKCLQGRCLDNNLPQEHKVKKGLKCFTRDRKRMEKVGHLPTEGSSFIEKNKGQEIQLKQSIARKPPAKRIRSLSSQDPKLQITFRYSQAANDPPRLPPIFNLQQSTITCSSLESRERRYSLDCTPKPKFMSRPTPHPPKHTIEHPNPNQINKSKCNDWDRDSPELVIVEEPLMSYRYGISTIKEEPEQKSSSLFQGAKSIVSRFRSSRKQEVVFPMQSSSKHEEKENRLFFDNIRLCQTQNAIVLTHSSIAYEDQKRTPMQQPSLECIPMSPHSKSSPNYNNFKIGRLLGVGKWAHIYLCQEKSTNSIFAIKEIFKESFKLSCELPHFNSEINELIEMSHSNLMQIYSKIQTADKLCLIVEYCNRNLFEELLERGLLPIELTRQYSNQLVKAIVYLHDSQRVHGSVNPFQVFLNFSQCKLKHSLTECTGKEAEKTVKCDIQGLAITIFQMGHGLIPLIEKEQTLYEKERMYQNREVRDRLVEYVRQRIELLETDEEYGELNQFVRMLLGWQEGCRLTSSVCLDHAFLRRVSD